MTREPDDVLAKANQALEELNNEIRLAHGMRKDLKADIKEVREERERTILAAADFTTQTLEAEVEKRITELGELAGRYAHEIYGKMTDGVTALSNIAIYGNEKGEGVSVFERISMLNKLVMDAVKEKRLHVTVSRRPGDERPPIEVLLSGFESREERRKWIRAAKKNPDMMQDVYDEWDRIKDMSEDELNEHIAEVEQLEEQVDK